MKENYFYSGDRFSYKNRKATIIDTKYEWINKEYRNVSVDIKCDDGEVIKGINPKKLTDDLRFLCRSDGWSHGYSSCKVYGISKEDLIKILSQDKNWEYNYFNGQEESDGSITFDAYRIIPDEVVQMLSNSCEFVFAWWHWDGDIFDCSKYENISVVFDRFEEGDEEGEYFADITVTANDKYTFLLGAGDFTSEEIEFYNSL